MKFVAPCLVASVMGQLNNFMPPMGVAPRQPLAPKVVVAQKPQAAAPAMDPMMLMLMADGKSDMKSLLPLLMMNGGGTMDPMMMMLLMDDKKSGDSLSSLLPLMMMGGMSGGQNGQMDPMMMMLLLGDNKSSGMKDLLPLMMMGGMNGQNGAGMNPLMMTMLLGEDCTIKNAEITKLTKVSDEDKIKLATGEKTYTGSALAAFVSGTTVAAQHKYIDHDYIKCKTGGSGLSDMLPLMMMGGMGGQQNGQAAMDPMMMMLMMGDSGSMSDMLPLMMMGGMGGQQNGANNMLPLLLMGDDEKSEAKCMEKFKVDAAYEVVTKSTVVTKQTDATAIFKLMKTGKDACIAQSSCVFGKSTWAKEYAQCIKDAAGKAGSTSSSSSSLKKMLPFMMMSGNGGTMDPMMMMLMLE